MSIVATLQGYPIEVQMVLILAAGLVAILVFSTVLPRRKNTELSTWLPPKSNAAKRQFEIYCLKYTVVWIGVFGAVVFFKMYEWFTEDSYMILCVSLAIPFLLQPFLWPMEAERCWAVDLRYSFKATCWIGIFSFIGSYWYTHYFYSVLGAKYTMPSHRLNNVPIALYFAAHFYFMTYHTASNMMLRKIETTYAPGWPRTAFFWLVVFAFSYFTAFMETLTISSFPDYSFDDKYMAYTLGSAFYGIYFIVSFPTYYRLDEKITELTANGKPNDPHTLYQTIMEAMGAGMLVLLLLDFCRIYCGIELNIPGVAYYIYHP